MSQPNRLFCTLPGNWETTAKDYVINLNPESKMLLYIDRTGGKSEQRWTKIQPQDEHKLQSLIDAAAQSWQLGTKGS